MKNSLGHPAIWDMAKKDREDYATSIVKVCLPTDLV